jgi:hypothetical protein
MSRRAAKRFGDKNIFGLCSDGFLLLVYYLGVKSQLKKKKTVILSTIIPHITNI